METFVDWLILVAFTAVVIIMVAAAIGACAGLVWLINFLASAPSPVG